MRRRRRERTILLLKVLAVLLAVPGLVLLVRDLARPSPHTVVERAEQWHPHVARAAERFGVPPELIIAVIATESKGDREARGDAGEVGLMQLMPATAREMAARLGLDPPAPDDLTDAALNILLGTAYLAEQLGRFGGQVPLALAAYNAGPGRVRMWQEARPDLPAAELIAETAFPSTREYVSTVLGYRELIATRSRERSPSR